MPDTVTRAIPHPLRRPLMAVARLVAATALALTGACTPTVKVATDDPITINLNVNIQHEIRIKVDRELEDLFGGDSDLF